MLTALALVSLLGGATLTAAVLARLADGLEHRRLARVAAQIRVTEAIHRTLGAIVAPTIAGHPGQPWTVTMGLGPRDFRVAGQLAEITRQSLSQDGTLVRIVFVPRAD